MLQHTRVEPLMEIRAVRDNVLHGTTQGISLVVVRSTDDVLRTVKLPILLVPGLKRNLFSKLAAAQKGIKRIIEKNGLSLNLGPFSVQLTRLYDMDHLDLKIVKYSRKTESALCAVLGESFAKESVLTALVPNSPVALSVGSISID